MSLTPSAACNISGCRKLVLTNRVEEIVCSNATHLTADDVSPSPKSAATRCHVSADGLKLADEIASKSMRRSRSAFH